MTFGMKCRTLSMVRWRKDQLEPPGHAPLPYRDGTPRRTEPIPWGFRLSPNTPRLRRPAPAPRRRRRRVWTVCFRRRLAMGRYACSACGKSAPPRSARLHIEASMTPTARQMASELGNAPARRGRSHSIGSWGRVSACRAAVWPRTVRHCSRRPRCPPWTA